MQPCEAAVPIEPVGVGPVDAGAVEDAQPARLDRVLGRAAGDHRAGEVARPGRVRARARPGSPPCSGCGRARRASRGRPGRPRCRYVLAELEVLVERQLEGAAVDDDDRRILLRRAPWCVTFGCDHAGAHARDPRVAGVEQLAPGCRARSARVSTAQAVARRHRVDVAGLEVDRRVARLDRRACRATRRTTWRTAARGLRRSCASTWASSSAPRTSRHVRVKQVAVARGGERAVDRAVDVDRDAAPCSGVSVKRRPL